MSEVVDEAVSNASIYPNPSESAVLLQFTAELATAQISIVNTLGLELLSQTVAVQSGVNSVHVNTSTLAVGSYLVRIAIGTHSTVLPLTVVR